MDCQRFQILLSAYIDNETSPSQNIFIENHIHICQTCEKYLKDLKQIKSFCQEISTPQPSSLDWNNFEYKIQITTRTKNLSSSSLQHILRYAASFILLITAAFYCFIMDMTPTNEIKENYLNLQDSFIKIKNARAVRDVGQNDIKHKNIEVIPNYPTNTTKNIKDSEISNLSSKEIDFLKQHGFVVTQRQYNSFVELYRDNQKNNIPSFVTIDTAILGFSHILARLRVDLEVEIFAKRLTDFTKILREQLLLLHNQVPKECQAASFQMLACIKVASQLLNCDGDWPPEIQAQIQDQVQQELALIYNGHENDISIRKSNIFSYEIDYNKFKIRGDDTQNENLSRYYLAMEWYSRCVFRTSNTETSLTETQSALLLLMAAIANPGDAIIIWDEMNQLFTALYGQMDDPHLLDYHETAREIFGDSLTPKILIEHDKIQKFCRAIENKKAPRIRSEVGLQVGLRIFGGRYYQRDAILQEFCFPYISNNEDPRVIPSLLDIAVILGHPTAYDIAIKRDYFRFAHYGNRIENYRSDIDVKVNQVKRPWQNGGLLTDAWIYRPLVSSETKGFPNFCYSNEWQARKLSSILCGIVHLSNSKPTFVGTTVDKFDATIDPYPEFFNRLLTNIEYIQKLLLMVGYPMNRQTGQEFLRYKIAIKNVIEISKKVLAGETLNFEDQQKLGNFVLGWQGDYDEANVSELSTLFHRNHTNYDTYFHAGVEPAREIWVICTNSESEPFLARGSVHLLYEFSTSKKILPNEWRKDKLWKKVQRMGTDKVAPWSKLFIMNE